MEKPTHQQQRQFHQAQCQGLLRQESSTALLETNLCVYRLVIPIKKILLDEETISRPIPTLSDRQFVVAQSSLSQAEQKAQSELFWYREELFKSVQGRWHEVSFLRVNNETFFSYTFFFEDWGNEIRRVIFPGSENDSSHARSLQIRDRPHFFIFEFC